MTRGIAFDWGGIFTEGTFDSEAVRNLSALLGVSEGEVAISYFPLMEELEAGRLTLEQFTTRFQQESGRSFDSSEFQRVFLASGRRRPSMYRLLAAIPDTYRVAMLSNNVPVLCDQVRRDPEMERIEVFLFSNELGVRKPDPEAFAALGHEMDLPPESILFIDDNADNVAACRELGFEAIHFTDMDEFLSRFAENFPEIDLEGVMVGEERRAIKLLQGYIWHPKELQVDLGDHLPRELEGEVHVLWDPLPRPPFSFFDDGTMAATQTVYQFTVIKLTDDPDENPGGLLPWLAETLQERLETTPEGVGWQVFEDLRDIG